MVYFSHSHVCVKCRKRARNFLGGGCALIKAFWIVSPWVNASQIAFNTNISPTYTPCKIVKSRRDLWFYFLLINLLNTGNRHFSVSRVTNSYTLSTPLYGHCLSVHCEFSLLRLFANLKTLDPGQIMTMIWCEFEELKPILIAWLPVFDPFTFFAFC